jgi:hypothetical protein
MNNLSIKLRKISFTKTLRKIRHFRNKYNKRVVKFILWKLQNFVERKKI